MSDSTSLLDLLTAGQAQKEVTANALFNAASPATTFANRPDFTSGLTWGYYGGKVLLDGVVTSIANGTIALTASSVNYLEADRAGTVSVNTTAFTPGLTPLYAITCGGSAITSYVDHRLGILVGAGQTVKAMADANQTLTAAEARCDILEATGALTALRDLIVPLAPQQWTVFANVTGGFGVRVIGASGTGITIADGMRAIVYSDGTNVVRATADV